MARHLKSVIIALAAVYAAFAGMAAAQEPATGGGFVGPHAGDEIFARDTYELTPMVCPFKGEIKYKPGEISCGLLAVPENREKPDSRFIELHYVKIAARKPKDWNTDEKGEWAKRDDPVIYLTGGPGAKAAGYVKRFKDHGVRDFRDHYILEQRGIGYSQDFCPLYFLIDPAAANTPDFTIYQEARLKAMEACFAAAKARGVDLSGYNTIENARDVKALRRALGFDKWNMWGISYGSILSQAYLKEDPEGVRAAAIDAIVPIAPGARFQKIGGSYQRDLDLLSAACAENPTCAKAFPDFVEQLKAAIVKIKDGEPIEVEAIDSELFPAGKAYFFHDLVGALPFIQLYEQDNYATLPAFIAALASIVESEEYDALRIATAAGGGGGLGFEISQGMYNAIQCNDNWAGYLREALEEDAREHPALASLQGDPAFAGRIAEICLRYGMAPRPASHYEPVETDIRTLLIEGQMDPVTPPPFAKMIEPGFSNATYVEFPYAGHGPSRSVKCAGEFLTKYFDDPDGELDLSCPESMEAPKFVGALYQTRALTRLAASVAEDEKNALAPALWAGVSALILIVAALIYSLAPIARLINGSQVLSTGGARPLAWLTATVGAAAIGGLGYAAYATGEASELVLLVGLLPIARWFVLAGLGAGFFGVIVLVLTVRARRREPLPLGVLSGLLLTGAAAAALAAFLGYWGFVVF
jgi:pimeloyl-ACP methyl ester carboxylesterase